jgi:hypothetical protein
MFNMRQNYFMKQFLLALALISGGQFWAQVTTINYTGTLATYTVPPGVTSIRIEALGAAGGTGLLGVSGKGAKMVGTFTVIPGEVLNVLVGGSGVAGTYVAGGGGGSFVWKSGPALLMAAGGGGGGGYTDVGGASYNGMNASTTTSGTNGNSQAAGGGVSGNGGTASLAPTYAAGGAGWNSNGVNGTIHGCSPNSIGGQRPLLGGAGGTGGGLAGAGGYGGGGGGNARCGAVGGGGGGGYSGGGPGGEVVSGRYDGGGGGGSFNGGTDQTNTAGLGAGNGQVIITVLCSPMTLFVSDYEICLGESVTMDADGAGTISWTGGVVNGVPYTPASTGTFTYNATSSSPLDCGLSVEILVNELPNVTASVDETEICLGESVIFSNSGADTYTWDPADVTAGDPYSPTEGTATYVVTGVNTTTGCENTAEVEVTVYSLPAVVANIDDEEICLGQEITLEGSGAETYVWDPATVEDAVAFAPDATGTFTYEVTGTDANGCQNTATTSVTVYEELTITFTTVDEMAGADGEIDITVTGGNPAYSFDWDNDGTGDFDDTEDLTGLAGGTYVVVIEDEAGCSATETIVLNSQLGIEINVENNISIYPNPTTAHITILAAGSFTYEITDVNGQIVLVANGVDTEEVSLEELASGIYFVNLTIADELTTIRIVKN